MKTVFFAIAGLLLTNFCFAQHIYQIRADSVRIYNVCDTAELILENRTQDTLGFLFNKGKGRTEFRKMQLSTIGSDAIAIVGQDTLNLKTILDNFQSPRVTHTDGRAIRITDVNVITRSGWYYLPSTSPDAPVVSQSAYRNNVYFYASREYDSVGMTDMMVGSGVSWHSDGLNPQHITPVHFVFNPAIEPFDSSHWKTIVVDGGTSQDLQSVTDKGNITDNQILSSDGGITNRFGYGTTAAEIGSTSNHGLKFFTNNLERGSFSAGGRLLLGTVTDDAAARLVMNGGISMFRSPNVAAWSIKNLAGLRRWEWIIEGFEPGSGNHGYGLTLSYYDDAGNLLGDAFSVDRATGFMRVGEGTAATEKLHVNGNIRGTGTLQIAGTATGAPALESNQYITRGQLTDSLDSRVSGGATSPSFLFEQVYYESDPIPDSYVFTVTPEVPLPRNRWLTALSRPPRHHNTPRSSASHAANSCA